MGPLRRTRLDTTGCDPGLVGASMTDSSDAPPAETDGTPARSRGTRLPQQPDGPAWLTVTSPLLPDADDLIPLIRDILDSRWVTNQGRYARELEARLATYLGVDDLVLVTNATVALEMAFLEAIDDGEVIIPAFSFPATWNLFFENPRFKPVFVDIGEDFRVDPDAVEAAITPRTTAIVAVHTYGFPCDHARLRQLANTHNLRLIYDSAHAFGVREQGAPIASLGDLNIYSFHATKVYNTLEGGCITGDPLLLERLRRRRNFGLSREEQSCFGTNGKVDEFRAAVGLLNLNTVDDAISARAKVARYYLDALPARTGLLKVYPHDLFPAGRTHNHAYFPVRLSPDAPLGRDALLDALKADGILARRYFYPTPTTSALYRSVVDPAALPVTRACSLDTLCLPVHHHMTVADCAHVVDSLARALHA